MDDDAGDKLKSGPINKDSNKKHFLLNHAESTTGHYDGNNIPYKAIIEPFTQFIASASNEALLGVFACVTIITTKILGRLGFLLIGIIVGFALHASCGSIVNDTIGDISRKHKFKKRELCPALADRLPGWRDFTFHSNGHKPNENETLVENVHSIDPDFRSFGPKTADALKSITDQILRDYVEHWSKSVLPSESNFTLSCRKVLVSFVTRLGWHICRKRPADLFLELLVNSSSLIIVFLNELATAFNSAGSSDSPERLISRYIDHHPESNLANLLGKEQQRKKISLVADDLLSGYLDSNIYDCFLVRDFLSDVLSSILSESAVSVLSRPETINGCIIQLLGERDHEIMNALDIGVGEATEHAVAEMNKTSSTVISDPTSKFLADNTIPMRTTGSAVACLKAKANMHAESSQTTRPAEPSQTQESVQLSLNHGCNEAPSHRDALDSPPQVDPYKQSSCPREEQDTTMETLENKKSAHNPVQALPSPSEHTTSQPWGSSPSTMLYRAFVTVDLNLDSGGSGPFRYKPACDCLLQIEPYSARSTGWMVFRKYADFETLHRTLETISRLNKIHEFSEEYPVVPSWKAQTRQGLAQGLQKYLRSALQHEPLAECEKMKSFLDKDGSMGTGSTAAATKTGLSFPVQNTLESVGNSVLGVFANAPKGVSGCSKAVFEGMTGVFGAGGAKEPASNNDISESNLELVPNSEADQEFVAGHGCLTQHANAGMSNHSAKLFHAVDESLSFQPRAKRLSAEVVETPGSVSPSVSREVAASAEHFGHEAFIASVASKMEHGSADLRQSLSSQETSNVAADRSDCRISQADGQDKVTEDNPITQEEAQMAVELIFAVINELYTLSSAWNIRRTLLSAAKSYLLRPGNPKLEIIRGLFQDSLIDTHVSDEAIGSYLNKFRESALPTRVEIRSRSGPVGEPEKERLKETARGLFVEKGLSQTLTGIMGAAASKEALGKVFDCLQVEFVAQGLMSSLLLQMMKAVIL
ncbi:PX domain protein [Aspergillus homomorphus CBS 101889]|uniref:PXA domain-containing protein n=1 Tax=Aspergillus homomorphus (strain CBS 101889) TaxID=1450537 RepID=A0A395I4V6_ASPHC|nr:hypothetical protein BO97DRAFT_385173 [Aspergillus homomorphus CBS 101889]RAL15017.1 hypothetical protein BO97DRAFT_385173 [Aspergillus homomorphus CBS 101889]